ncbi:DUF4188 domain-containing protein [Fodinicola feengrottensis]|uniref:DUF4188 domain-containing protein n=1 Tax=Fodinicola feengrottensis TaxID=435914 RepID=A0ABN2J8E2_9ACTN|nr:DUF4188 domain-containing protein [Fodinicola feengrottensis]
MGAKVYKGRWTAEVDQDTVVFLLGMRFNRLRAVTKWVPALVAMPKMLRELAQDPDSGLLGWHMSVGWRTISLIQYWKSVDQLTHYAGDAQKAHRPAWLAYFRNAFKGGSVGFWHETYVVSPGTHEQIYLNMPGYGLGAATSLVEVGKAKNTARERLGQVA